METANSNRNAKIVELLSEAVDSLAEAVTSGRLGFDYAVKEYVERSDNEISRALQEYVQAFPLEDDTERESSEDDDRISEEIRRTALQKFAQHFASPEVNAFVTAVLEAQDKSLSIGGVLEQQAMRLRQLRS